MNSTHKKALTWLTMTIFLLFADPLIGYRIGPVPIYVIDFFVFITWVYARQMKITRRFPLQGFVIFILISMTTSELVSGIRAGVLIEPIYMILRTTLAISLFFSVPTIIQSRSDFEAVLKAGLLGALITATLMIASSLPQTQRLVARYIFSLPILTPLSNNLMALYGSANIVLRGWSLVGISIISGAFLNTIWPLLFLLRTDKTLPQKWRMALNFATILIPIGIVFSYSRGAIIGLLLIVVIVVLLNSTKVRQSIVMGVGLSILIFSQIGWNSQFFMFSWLESKTQYQLNNFYEARGITERLYAYTQPFEHVIENPQNIFMGDGLALKRTRDAVLSELINPASHAVFASAYYAYGLLTAFAYVLMLLGAFGITWKNVWRLRDDFLNLFSRAMLASLFGLSSWFMVGHAPVSESRGAMLLFFIFGLVAAQSNFINLPKPLQPDKGNGEFLHKHRYLGTANWNERRENEL